MNDVNRLIEKIGARRFDIAEPFGAHSDYISGFDDCAALVIDSLCEDAQARPSRNRVIEQPKYINAAALKDALLEASAINPNGVGIIDGFPAAEVVEIKYGRWIPFHSEFAGDIQYCSACDIGFPDRVEYCPHCGAWMIGAMIDNEID